MSVFHRLHPLLREAIVHRLGWTALRPVQELAGEAILAGENAVVLAPTAGGKTEAAMFPALHGLLSRPPGGVGVLYLAPIKALLNNQAERLGTYTEMVGLRRFVWHGDTSVSDKRRFVREPTELLMTTPESLEVMLASARVPVEKVLAGLELVVIDEVHALAGTDRGAHLMSVLARLARRDLQRVGLSATVGNPDAILTWLSGGSARGRRVVDPPKVPTKRRIEIRMCADSTDVAADVVARTLGQKSLVFCESRSGTEELSTRMRGAGIDVFVHHSSVAAVARQAAEERFARGSNAAILCTSTLELGIDVGDLDHVFQVEAPATVSSFLQRMGRTGRRAGAVANTTFVCTGGDAVLQAAGIVELARRGFVESVPVNDRCWPVLVHQLLAMALEKGTITASAAWSTLQTVPDFAGITRAEFDEVVTVMVERQFLFADAGRLAMGDAAERAYGRKNFMELYAVFSSPTPYVALTTHGQELGTLDQLFVDSLDGGEAAFLLGGRAWLIEQVSHAERRVVVVPAPRGKKPSWTSYLPQFVGGAVCRAMRSVLASDTVLPYVAGPASDELEARRSALGEVLRGDCPVVFDAGNATWWTFAGGRANTTLRYALELLKGWKVTADNVKLIATAPSILQGEWADVVRDLASQAFWDQLMPRLQGRLPPYRLSKFQPALPEWAQREMTMAYLLDVPGAMAAAAECAFRRD